MYLESSIANLFASEQFARDVWIAGGCYQCREPIQSGYDTVLNLAGGNLARPAHDRGHAEAPFQAGALTTSERGLSAIRPGEVLSAVVGGEDDDGVVIQTLVCKYVMTEPTMSSSCDMPASWML